MKSIANLLLIILISSCSSMNKPYSQVDGSWSNETDKNNYDLIITRVNGKPLVLEKQRITLDPGSHQLRVVSTKEDPSPRDKKSYADFTMTLKPCIRYYISGQHANPLSLDMDIKVIKTEVIESCIDLTESNNKLVIDAKNAQNN